MSEPKVDFFYGIYPSSVHGNLILIDPILPPKKCPLSCAVCPLTIIRETTGRVKPDLNISLGNIVSSVEKCQPTGIEINGALLWGYGDPLLTSNIYELLIILRAFMIKRGLGRKLYIHSSLVPLVEACCERADEHEEKQGCIVMKSIVEHVDGIILPFLWYDVDKYILGWPRELNFNTYVNTIRQVVGRNYDKLFIELYLFKLHESCYPDVYHLDEVAILLKQMRSKNVVLKPVDRPTSNQRLKPVPESQIAKVEEHLVKEGFKTHVEKFNQVSHVSWQCGVAHLLYNYILRIPLRHSEVRYLFGEVGLIALSNLLSKNHATRVTWAGEIFFAGAYK